MPRLSKLHKLGAHTVFFILVILSVSGFFLNHKTWNFLYTTTFRSVPESVLHHNDALISGYWIDPKDEKHVVVAGKRGVYESLDQGHEFKQTLALPCNAIKSYEDNLYVATHNGIYRKNGQRNWSVIALPNESINSMGVYADRIIASVDQSEIVILDLEGNILERTSPKIEVSELEHDISLARLIRDIHYGRGLFDGISSLILNDFGTIMLAFLLFSGMMISIFIYQTRKKIANRGQAIKQVLRLHATPLSIVAGIPLILIALTGIVLDHSKLFTPFLKSISIASSYQPPVYHKLSEDIWSVDYDGRVYRLGNRHGVYQSDDFKTWRFENKGFAYKMIRNDEALYVSGMGAPSRTLSQGKWEKLEHAPHMFKDVMKLNGKTVYLKGHKNTLPLPHFHDATLYSVLFALHEGSFFGEWWAYVNDVTAAVLIFLLISGTILWIRIQKFKGLQ